MATSGRTLNLCGVLSESKRIINAHSRHFLALSVLFLLPLSFSLIIFPTLQSTLTSSQPHSYHHSQTLLRTTTTTTHTPPLQTLALPFLLYSLFYSIFFLTASLTITYSTYHGFYGRPVKLAHAAKSLLSSFLPLLATSIASQLLIALVCAAFGVFPFAVAKGVQILLGFDEEIDYATNHYFLGLCGVVFVVLALVLVYLKVNWALACVVVVVESKWGFEPLRRSAYLMRGMRLVSLSLWLLFGTLIAFFVSAFGSGPMSVNYDFSDVWTCLSFISQTVVGSSFVTMFMLYNIASHAVLYMYCKALHGELAWEIAEEFAREYVSLPFDDAKVPHVVFVAPLAA
ncbi:hypothetical protein Vadar_024619 [Vaccinium darrowii]|uniref:Uncharacterized protein n=1 Tax=Vaccinium darrowii TaxID=229202 RepID=A0ACB7YZ31_9ERIC|nr:hypothetical protein Vadar_024619 [Vaccinium darrowii]